MIILSISPKLLAGLAFLAVCVFVFFLCKDDIAEEAHRMTYEDWEELHNDRSEL